MIYRNLQNMFTFLTKEQKLESGFLCLQRAIDCVIIIL